MDSILFVFRDYELEEGSDIKKLKSEVEKLKDKTVKEIGSQKEKFQKVKTPPKELSDWVKQFQAYCKQTATRGSGLVFDIKYQNKFDEESQSLKTCALVNVTGQKPYAYKFLMESGRQGNAFAVTYADGFYDSISDTDFKAQPSMREPKFKEDVALHNLIEHGYKKLKTKGEQNQHEFRKLQGEHVKVEETETENVIFINGSSDIEDSWKSTLHFSSSEENSMKSRVEKAVKDIKAAGGKTVSGSIDFEEIDYYDGADTFETPSISVRDDKVTLTSNRHHDIPKAWGVNFGFKITFPKNKRNYDLNSIRSALDTFVDAAKVKRWGNAR